MESNAIPYNWGWHYLRSCKASGKNYKNLLINVNRFVKACFALRSYYGLQLDQAGVKRRRMTEKERNIFENLAYDEEGFLSTNTSFLAPDNSMTSTHMSFSRDDAHPSGNVKKAKISQLDTSASKGEFCLLMSGEGGFVIF